MISKANFQLLQLQINFTSFLGMTPFQFNHKNILVTIPKVVFRQYFWFAVVILSFITRFYEFSANISEHNNASPMVVAFQGILLGCHFCGILHFAAISQNREDFVKLVNSLRTFGKFERVDLRIVRNARRDDLILAISASVGFVGSIAIIIVPVIASTFPAVHKHILLNLCNCNGSNYLQKILIFLCELLSILPSAAIGPAIGTLCLVSVSCIHENLKGIKAHSTSKNHQLCTFFRQLQILGMFCDKCFQQYIWISFQFTGAAFIISSLYATIVFGHRISNILILLLVTICIVTIIFCLSLLEIGSMPQLISKKILVKWKLWRDDKYHKKWLRSCKPITMQVGPLHKLDRQRGPALIRFCLQRTFFFVVKTRSSNGGFGQMK
ncbi:unnamed protein product [Orchesella dallaii]|uniref:Odorant receptor n=1 Tax=Orchesella dallaii TaxID=48710 RepID=A0ABP1RJM4_9HEXA